MQVQGKIIVVTGAASGIGRSMARRFKADGARQVVCADRDAEGVRQVAAEIGAVAMTCDVSREADIQALVEKTEAGEGPIDIFCSNAGIGVGGGAETPNDAWQRIWDINVMAHVWAARHVVPLMIGRGGGYLVNTASAAGLLSQIGSAPYAVTKHAAVALAEWLSITHGDDGIKVSVLCPQAVRTAMTAGNPDGVASIDGMMEPDDVAEAVVRTIEAETFLILPHAEVLEYMRRKTGDYDRWLGGMRKLNRRFRG
jgi:NAD(P)-dependent dehydrogenase (short-subunit alcohol dehydrogenase family)